MDLQDGLEVSALQEVQMGSTRIIEAVKALSASQFVKVQSMLLYRDGKLVVEVYFGGHQYMWDGVGYHGDCLDWGHEDLHVIISLTKSITSACLGLAIDQGHINSVYESIFNYYSANYASIIPPASGNSRSPIH